ncbi:MAG TPA: ester cyclase [Terriglobales bacterium]|jgi:steroid delta-isomerase-like uncharacterized protein|nr:ester cyclase [Terriglobales bacterium]
MQEANKALARRWFKEVWNEGKLETIDELLSPNAPLHGLGETDVEVRGPAGFKPFVNNLRSAFPDIRITIEDIIAEGDKVSLRLDIKGTHKGQGLDIPPTGKAIRVAAIVTAEIKGGKIVAGWNSWDQLGLLRQLGALGAPRSDDRFLAAQAGKAAAGAAAR